MARTVDVDELVERGLAGDPRSVGRLITLVEDGAPQLRALMAALASRSGSAHIVGLTGSPGVGKSTTTSALVAQFRAAGRRVGVLAVDPSSPFSGGALLGDRIRMQEHATDPEVFIRSMASRGHLGGLASATPQAVRVLDAAGCDPVLVETVGVGQSEVEVAGEADTTIVLLAPGMGDGIQAAKAGILEVGDIFVVNKADRDGADATARELRHMISLGPSGQAGAWKPPVLKVIATRGEGLSALVAAIDEHRAWLESSGTGTVRRRTRARSEIQGIALAALQARFAGIGGDGALEGLADDVAAGRTDAFTAADRIVAEVAGRAG
ncbi:MAG TPA: methylmalonyl Co-A mutase-associated GTPase MeaB [Candidatus Limnocylindrales bacterium]|nr:methylmalonyl Co-A mutase-associated GTPase MeaB [Candidatus Limnocylindrales bacterium]